MRTPKRGTSMVAVLAIGFIAAACVSSADPELGSEEQPAVDEGNETDGGNGTADGGGGPAGELAVGAVASPGDLASLESVRCSFDERVPLAVQPSCYAASVPEDWADPDPGDQVVLQLAVFEGDGSADDGLIYFDGGPGGHTLDSLSFTFSGLVEPFLGARDYIVFDQRGVGTSEPSLACPESTEVALEDLGGRLAPESVDQAQLDALAACRDRLVAAGVNLGAYNSIASANDVEAIRALLGYDRLNVISVSYGTRLAQTYMRMYPQSIRSVVLDSVLPTGYDLWSNFDTGAVRAFEQLFDGCAQSDACQRTYPDLKRRFAELLDRLDEDPAELEVANLLDGSSVPLVVDGDDAMGLVFSALYDRGRFSAVPQLVEDALAGDYQAIELFGSILVTNLDFVSQGMRLSVECNEEIPFEAEQVLRDNRPTDPLYSRLGDLEGGLTMFDLCRQWPAGTAPEVESLSIESDLPTLLLAGQYDPITPPRGAEEVAAGLSHAYSFVFPNEGHGITPTACGSQLVEAFIDDPDTEPDGSCIADSPVPLWTPPLQPEPIELVEFEVDGLVAVSGLRPEGWTDAGNGVFARQQTALDPTTLLIQPTNGLAARNLIDLLAGQLDIAFTPADPLEIDGVDWAFYTSSAVSDQGARAAISSGPDGLLVLLVASNDEIESLFDSIFVEVVAAAVAG